ncbi:MAG: chorismate mutase [Methanobrevibacter sp.]|jgi:chorismate mutase|nr:chorismate mutase [Methanobrevibacter sp.]
MDKFSNDKVENQDNKNPVDKNHAKELLLSSRNRIDEIDKNLIKLIAERNFLSKNIIKSKILLDMEIFDENREKLIYEKIEKLAIENNLNTEMIFKIINILIDFNKSEQEKFLGEM